MAPLRAGPDWLGYLLLIGSPLPMFKKLFAFPLEIRPRGWTQWRVRFVPLAVWTCLLNALIFGLIVCVQR